MGTNKPMIRVSRFKNDELAHFVKADKLTHKAYAGKQRIAKNKRLIEAMNTSMSEVRSQYEKQK